MTANPAPPTPTIRQSDWWRRLGPGLITGVADDDPSGISTYTITGASFGYQMLWTSLATLPMTIATQSLCARIGLVTGRGLASAIAQRYGRRCLAPLVALLFFANLVNIGADIEAIGAAIELLTGWPARLLFAPIAMALVVTEIVVPYRQFALALKALTLVIFAYVITAFVAQPNWGEALMATVWPRVSLDRSWLQTIVAILGTTISPYLFFWQTSEEVEEEEADGVTFSRLTSAQQRELLDSAQIDVNIGMATANIGFYFIVLTAAATLHANGLTQVQTAAQAAEALRPLAGDAATLLFAVGIIGTGLLAVPVLAGSSAYALAELFGWREGLNNTFRRAPQFYLTIALATLFGVGLDFSGVPAMQALYLAAIVNGVCAPVLLVFVAAIASDQRVMGAHRPNRTLRGLTWLTAGAMALAAIGMFVVN